MKIRYKITLMILLWVIFLAYLHLKSVDALYEFDNVTEAGRQSMALEQ